jgi:3-hydroxyisobutyrate dehydrogenase-like beta-hydroxyacid dehydrogenase
VVYNRTVSKSQKLQEEMGDGKIKIVESPGQLAMECDVIITNLANDEVVRDMYIQFAEALSVSEPVFAN